MISNREKRMLAYYEQRGRDGITNNMPYWADSFVSTIFADVPRKGLVVDVGCGDGRFTEILDHLNLGSANYLGIDPCPSQVLLAQSLRLGYRFEVGSIYDIGAKYPSRFDGFVCLATLMLFPRPKLLKALVSLRTSLRASAVGFVSTPMGSGDVRHEHGIVISLYEIEELRNLFDRAGLDASLYPNGEMIIGAICAR